jgi:hypothetical protein
MSGVVVDLAEYQFRGYGWVDVPATDRSFDPTMVGATMAALHRVS